MANEKLIYASALANVIHDDAYIHGKAYARVRDHIEEAKAVDAVEVVRIEEVKREMLQTIDTLIATHRDISNSQFSEFEKHLDIPKSSNDYYGIYADTMDIARRLVNAALTELCSYGERREGE